MAHLCFALIVLHERARQHLSTHLGLKRAACRLEREGDRERPQTQRDRERQTDRHREREGQTHRERQRERERQTDAERHTERDRCRRRVAEWGVCSPCCPRRAVRGQGLSDAAQLSWEQASRFPCPRGNTPQQAKARWGGSLLPRAHTLVEKHIKHLPYN